jgi:repressor LexA
VAERFHTEEKSRRRSTLPEQEIPLMGRIAAGAPVEAIQNPATLHFSDFVGKGATFALEVRGESMIEDHICNGDFVLAEKTDKVRDGDIVVALVEGSEATLKRYYHQQDGRIRLQPANATMSPIFVNPADLEIQGRVLAVMRKY